MIPIDKYITGDRFKAVCDYAFDIERPTPTVGDIDIVFTCTHDLRACLDWTRDKKNRFVVVAHNSDGNVLPGPGRDCDFHWTYIPENVVHVFSQNVDVEDERLTPIPIGFENAQYFPRQRKMQKLHSYAQMPTWKTKGHMLQVNMWTNPQKRIGMWQEFRGGVNRWVLDVDVYSGRNGWGYDEYLSELYQHSFMFCPDGNGIDCVRTWEALTVGTIPLTEDHVCTRYFAKLFDLRIYKGEESFDLRIYKGEESFDMVERGSNPEALSIDFWHKMIMEKAGRKWEA